ncbi:MAG: hypothetical protein U0904_04890 [Candidatus Nanopelagicales bacterium]|nr:hypothetical protein [Candidatus Nanopelagicales bacterium]
MGDEVKRTRTAPGAKRIRTTRVSSKNQITLPVAALAAAHVATGDELVVEAQAEGRILLVRAADPLEPFLGKFPGLSAATGLEELRDEWDR